MSSKKELQQWAKEELQRIEREEGMWMAYPESSSDNKVEEVTMRDVHPDTHEPLDMIN